MTKTTLLPSTPPATIEADHVEQPDYLMQQFFGLKSEVVLVLAGEEITRLPVQALLPQE